MRITAQRVSRASIALAAVLLAALAILFSPLPASAHDGLTGSSPEAGSTLETLPTEVTLTFSADLIGGEGSTEVVVLDVEGNNVADGPAIISGPTVTQPLRAEGVAGDYQVIWKVVSSDGHPTSDQFSFAVTTGTAVTPSEEPSTEPSAQPSEESAETSDPMVTQAPDVADSNPASGWIWALAIAGVLVAAGVAVWLVLRSRASRGSAESDTSPER